MELVHIVVVSCLVFNLGDVVVFCLVENLGNGTGTHCGGFLSCWKPRWWSKGVLSLFGILEEEQVLVFIFILAENLGGVSVGCLVFLKTWLMKLSLVMSVSCLVENLGGRAGVLAFEVTVLALLVFLGLLKTLWMWGGRGGGDLKQGWLRQNPNTWNVKKECLINTTQRANFQGKPFCQGTPCCVCMLSSLKPNWWN